MPEKKKKKRIIGKLVVEFGSFFQSQAAEAAWKTWH